MKLLMIIKVMCSLTPQIHMLKYLQRYFRAFNEVISVKSGHLGWP